LAHLVNSQKQIKKVWTAKLEKNIDSLPPANTNETASSHKENAEACDNDNESAATTWTIVRTANKHKGKEHRVEGKNIFGCTNGFEALRTGECSLASDDKVP
jgi:hypothetical protein